MRHTHTLIGPRRRLRVVVLAAVCAALSLVAAACGSSSSTASSSVSPSSATGSATTTKVAADASGSGSAIVTQAQQAIDKLYQGQEYHAPPTTGPKPQAGKNVWVITPGLSLAGSGLFAGATQAAGKAIGWKVTVFDGKLNPAIWPDGIRQAIAAKADAIILYDIDCPTATAAMQQARRAGIPLIATESVDCSFVKPGAPSVFSAQVTYTEGMFPSFATSLGTAQANYVIAKSDGHANVIEFSENDLETAVLIGKGFDQQMAKCSGCKIVDKVTFTASDTGPALQQKAQQALLQHPEATAVVAPYDDVVVAGIGAAIVDSSRKDKLLSVAGAGFPANMDLVRHDNGQSAGYAVSVPWEGYAAIDTVNRVLHGMKAQSSGIGVGFFDKTHDISAAGPYVPPIDFAKAYEKTWSGG
jgi:ribose transport system substrate-binding protein